ncbi:hypothetical protein CC86DRAFT_443278 [Ophiobolus disseminans]|uniref:WD40 repeat-like protein n=1 Tax=Ophiobolus disseminans TaxID=1469910 RepID=A0A6A7AGH5_9PLEO|nr:hypothetical protein CC86DRAFT_443278 [Ophiobolus disseminans]
MALQALSILEDICPVCLRRTPDVIATSISPSGWVAAATPKHVRLYNAKDGRADKLGTIPVDTTISINLNSNDEIRAIALSEDLRAVLTRSKLLVYDEYRTSPDPTRSLVEDKSIEQGWSVSILQTGTAATWLATGANASVAVGARGVAGVKVFQYVYAGGWNAKPNYMQLLCPGNISALKIVGFSPHRSNSVYGSLAYALTKTNRLYCWRLRQDSGNRMQELRPSWYMDCNSLENQTAIKDEITSAAMAVCTSGRPYIICTVDHQDASHLLSSFTVPVDLLRRSSGIQSPQLRHISDTVIGLHVLTGVVSANGNFLAIVEYRGSKNFVKVLVLRERHDGGLTFSTLVQKWKWKLLAKNAGPSLVTISIEEEDGAFDVTAVDAKGHITSARVSVPGMQPDEPMQSLSRGETRTSELPDHPRMVSIGELSSGESSRHSTSTAPIDERAPTLSVIAD